MLNRVGRWVAFGSCAALALSTVTVPAATAVTLPESVADGVPAEIEDLGIGAYSQNVRLADTAVLADGTPVGYFFNDGEPVSFNMVDLSTQEVLFHEEFPGYTVASAIVVNPDDNMVYLSVRAPNDGTLWSFDPEALELDVMATGIVGEGMLRTLVLHEGIIYGSTYPGAKVYSIDPATGDIRDYGNVDPDSSYAWGFTEVGGNMWVGTGTNPTLSEVNVETGELTPIELPQEVIEGADFINGLVRHDDLVIMRYRRDTPYTKIYDLTAGGWCCDEIPPMTHWTDTNADGKFYFRTGDVVLGFDIASRSTFSIGWEEQGMSEELGLADTISIHLMDLETGPTIMGARNDGAYWFYDPATQTAEVHQAEIEGAPATIHSAGVGPDGNPYFGMYLSSGVISRVDHATGTPRTIAGPKQADAMATVGDKFVLGEYPGALFHVRDVADGWEWGYNPDPLVGIERSGGQDRVSDLIAAGDLAAAATIPNYGELGGALVLFDPEGDGSDAQIHRNIVQDHSVVSLEYRDGLIYAGTSINGGIDSTPTTGPAHIIVWDVDAQEMVTSVPVEGTEIVHSMEFDAAGNLWAMADNGAMLRFDTEGNTVAETIDTGIANSNVWGRTSELHTNPVNGLIYGNAAGTMFVFHPETGEVETFGPGEVRYSTVVEDGTVYFGDRTNVYRFGVDAVEDVPGEDPSEPSDDPTEPGDDPTEPGDDPTQPGDEPTEPGKPGDDRPRPGLPSTGV